jgi:ATP-dependent DNA helicase RecQ
VPVSEYIIAKNLSLPKEIIIADLNRLHRFQMIRYQPPVNTPQIRFPEGRPVTDEWIVRPHELNLRKKRFEERVDSIIQYASDMQTCRSVIMAAYFGDTQAESCGICDNCLSVKRKERIDFNSFQSIRLLLKDACRNGHVDIKSFLSSFSEEEKEKIMDVIKHLADEEEISINQTGAFIFN